MGKLPSIPFEVQPHTMATNSAALVRYGRLVLLVAGLGGLLYGIDVGIIAAALLYLSKTINLTLEQTSIIVAAVLGGSMVSSLIAGALADWLGRKTMMVVSGVLFVTSVGIIVLAQGFLPLFIGRLLQGMSGGVIAVVVPLYLAECLSAASRGRGTAIFQFMLTLGVVLAALTGWYYTRNAETAIAAAAGNPALVAAAQNHAWRGMFLSIVYPGLLFFAGSLLLSETPRWLFRRGRVDAALAALRKSSSEEDAQLQLREMQALAAEEQGKVAEHGAGTLLQRKYVLPFLLACVILACNQATGINSILAFLVIILRQAGMTARHATQGDVVVKVLNCVMTIVAIALVDRKGRRFLLKIGTAGIVLALLTGALLFRGFEAKRTDVKPQIEAARSGNRVTLPLTPGTFGAQSDGTPSTLTVLYSYGAGDKVASVLTDEHTPLLSISPDDAKLATAPLTIKRAFYGSVPAESTGWMIAACLCVFICCFSAGPGVVVWLTLSELMPTRIRSVGMGLALLLNQGVSTAIAAVFLPVVGAHGYSAMFAFWAACTMVYFITAAFFLPETKGKTLEEIEKHFERGGEPEAA